MAMEAIAVSLGQRVMARANDCQGMRAATCSSKPGLRPKSPSGVQTSSGAIVMTATYPITQAQAQDLILPHMQCISKECPACFFWEPIARSLNLFFSEGE